MRRLVEDDLGLPTGEVISVLSDTDITDLRIQALNGRRLRIVKIEYDDGAVLITTREEPCE
jgi:hypothetical protein